MSDATIIPAIDGEDQMRADLYALIGRQLFFAPSETSLAELAGLSGGDTEMGRAFNAISE